MSASITAGDVGTVIRYTIKDQDGVVVDISTATTKQIILRSPAGKKLTKTATFTTSGTDGKIQYSTQAGDIDTPGVWSRQAKIVLPGGTFYTDILTFPVEVNL